MKQRYRSRLNTIPTEVKEEIAEYVLQWGMPATNRRIGILETFKKHNIDVTELGTGTNRLIVKYNGFALKIALDDEGVDDNRQEWVMSDLLAPNIARAHEISGGTIFKEDGTSEIIGGHLLVADYAPAFTSWGEMLFYQTKISKILDRWSDQFMLGDVGITKKNYANWGMLNGRPVCIDYAYIFPANMNLFECICGNHDLKIVKDTYSVYRCTNPKCCKTFSDADLRSRIPNSKRHELFSQVEGISMTKEYEEHDVDPKYIFKNKAHIQGPYDFDVMEIAKAMNKFEGYSNYRMP